MKDTKTKKTVLTKTDDEINFMVRVQNIKAIAGSTVEDMIMMGWSDSEIVQALRSGKGASQKLIKGGYYKDC